ncbi:GH32 C-terminal domain-containing protein [Halobacillus mangrovi]|uniref:GH32 C-terminal domain-containing protein n=1 Tax=Halobacillus mangrovi TaxID=402384 RepID=UPI003D95A237
MKAPLLASWKFDEGKGKHVREQVSGEEHYINYVFNEAKYKPNSDPVWRKGLEGSSLLFDGYSTWVESEGWKSDSFPEQAFTVAAWIAARSFESGNEKRLTAVINQHHREEMRGFILGHYRHGECSFQVGTGEKWLEVWSGDEVIPAGEWAMVAGTFDSEACKLNLFINGTKVAEKSLTAGSRLVLSDQPLWIGKNNQALMINEAVALHMFSGLIDEVTVYKRALSDQEVLDIYESRIDQNDGSLPEANVAMDRSRLADDPHRPGYHFLPPEHWMNEPHAPLYFEGKYHLFYQANPRGPFWHNIHWGHMVSEDLVHWHDLPMALMPEKGAVDPDGDWSGSAVVDDDGIPVLFITAGDDSVFPPTRTAIARSTFPEDGDRDLKCWQKHPEVVTVQEEGLKARTGGIFYGQFRDPFVWKEGNRWIQIIGSGIKEGDRYVGGTALMYSSNDLERWTYEGSFMEGDYAKYPKTGHVWELPVFLPLGRDSSGKEKHVFLINPWYDYPHPDNIKYVWYWIGSWDAESLTFAPDHEEPRLTDVGEHFTGPSGMVDPKGRSLVFSIAQGKRLPMHEYEAGWAHNGGIPVELGLHEDDSLMVRPIEEMALLRKEQLFSLEETTNAATVNEQLKNVQGDMLEINLEVESDQASAVGMVLRHTDDHDEETILYYDHSEKRFEINREKSSLDEEVINGIEGGEVEINSSTVKLHIFLDRSMIEVYLDERIGLTSRVYPTRREATGLSIWANKALEDVSVHKLRIWSMNSAYS